ncbi:MAG TPA: hypothetical protein VIS77_13655 [Burkholderiales bacterium]
MLEGLGIATVTIGLVRPHMEKTRGPRGLFVPFPLGRPLGEAGDAGFQRRVLRAALALLERSDGPVILEDFPEDAPTQAANPAWSPPFELPARATPATSAEWAAALAAEMSLVRPWWEKARARLGRSTVGLSAQAPEAWAKYAAAFLDGELPAPPAPLTSPAYGLRFLCDDLKAFYFEAAQAAGPVPSPTQVNPWFFHRTVAGAFLVALRAASLASADKGLNLAGGRFLIPANWLKINP